MPDSNEALTIELQDHSTIVLRRKEKDRELSGSSKKEYIKIKMRESITSKSPNLEK
ncbi:hypothetical protein Loa_00141 [Legionella oakridgensis ATCC 33761 = DSM 21215]|uniref:Uncharacterized protein n=1 Tax=Legionella oakridgensis ATCC 33761 = DSM 21215 TaxID=1268635 RepID=W0BAT1_9GAMM|nr:hypothetical protein Loa_00141 [Legionella oakridgensis ATCC 33761 = DSM 21215]